MSSTSTLIIPVQNNSLCWMSQKQKLNHLAMILNLFYNYPVWIVKQL